MEKRRNITFTAGIMNIVAYSIYILLTMFLAYVTFITLALIIDLAEEAEATAMTSIVSLLGSCVIRLILAITSIIMSAKIIKLSKASVQDYNAAKSKIMSVVIINFIVVVYGFISYISSGISSDLLLISIGEILMFVAMLVVAILLLVDINKNKKAAEAEQAQIISSTVSTAAPSEVTTTSTPAAPEADDKIDKLAKLNDMKASGLISDEEYEQMKADLLK